MPNNKNNINDDKNTPLKPPPLDWRGVGTITGAGLGSFLGIIDDHLILYTLIGTGLGFMVGCLLSSCFKRKP